MADPLAPETWPFSLSWLPNPAYLVGGGVRDALRGYQSPYLDLDFVLPSEAVETARAIAQHYQAGFVLLDAERHIARVVFQQATADFALQVGPTLKSDLERRDFTINAIAYELHSQKFFDPLGGKADLKRGLLRMISAQNLAEDPLRLLRAYRQAGQLSFDLDPETQSQIRRLAPNLIKVAAERVRVELSYLLFTPKGIPLLRAAIQDGLLQDWLPQITPSALDQLSRLDQAALSLQRQWPALELDLHRSLSDRTQGGEASRRTLLSTAKLSCLIGQHSDPALQMQRLKYSRNEVLLVVNLLRLLPQVKGDDQLRRLSRPELYFLFQQAGTALPALVLMAIAQGTSQLALTPILSAWLNPEDEIAHPPLLITGKDLLEQLQLKPGPGIGNLLKQLELAQAKGTITTPAEARQLAQDLSQNPLGMTLPL
jgi:tRNA nucleotidyltransferase (CCA-adding enzyme)